MCSSVDELGSSELATQLQTQEGAVMGTVPYMSPEQLRGRPLDHRSDLFSYGVLLYELSTGHRPFTGESSPELASAILRDAPTPPTKLRKDLPAVLTRAESNPNALCTLARPLCNGGQIDEGLSVLERAIDAGSFLAYFSRTYLRHDPAVWQHTRFQSLLRSMRLDDAWLRQQGLAFDPH